MAFHGNLVYLAGGKLCGQDPDYVRTKTLEIFDMTRPEQDAKKFEDAMPLGTIKWRKEEEAKFLYLKFVARSELSCAVTEMTGVDGSARALLCIGGTLGSNGNTANA